MRFIPLLLTFLFFVSYAYSINLGKPKRSAILLTPTATTQSFWANLNLLNADNSIKLADGALAEFNENYSAGVNWEDASKFTNPNEMLAFSRNGYLLAAERRPLIVDSDTLFLSLTKTTPRAYQFVFTSDKLGRPDLVAFLEDSYTGTTIPLNLQAGNTINFVVDNNIASKAANRFRVIFKSSAGGPVPVKFSSIKALQQSHSIAVEWKVENELNIHQYEVERSADGNDFTKMKSMFPYGINNASATYSWFDMAPLTGNSYYRVRCTDRSDRVTYSNIVNIRTTNNNAGIAAYPNPVKGGILGFQMNDMPRGIYNIRIIDMAGVVVMKKQLVHTGGDATKTLSIGNAMANGIYQLEISSPDNNKTTIALTHQ